MFTESVEAGTGRNDPVSARFGGLISQGALFGLCGSSLSDCLSGLRGKTLTQ